jgi:hypothetical protein
VLRIVALVFLLLLSACSIRERDAAHALADARSVLAAIHEDAARFEPEELAAVEATLRDLDGRLRDGDDAAVHRAVPALTDRLRALRSSALARRGEMAARVEQAKVEWSAMAADLPARLAALDRRVAELGRERKLPAGLDRAKLDAARQSLTAIKASFVESAATATSGDALQAVDAARAVRAQAAALAISLGLPEAG